MKNGNISLRSLLEPSRIQKLSECSSISWQCIYLFTSVRICSLYDWTHLETLVMGTRFRTGMSNLGETCVGSGVTWQLYGTQVGLMEPIKPLANTGRLPCLQSAQRSYQGNKDQILAGAGHSGYWGDLERRGNHPNLCVEPAMSDGKDLAWLLATRGC